MTVRWKFYDPITAVTTIFPINPKEGGLPQFEKTFSEQQTVAPDGRTLLFEGRDKSTTITFSGTILDKDQYDMFVAWFAKRRQVRLTDDNGVVNWVYLTKFQPKRIRRRSHPWAAEYTAECQVVNWP